MSALLAAWTFLKSPLGRALAGAVAILVVAGGIYLKGRHDGRHAVLQGLQDDRVTVLKDGRAIDDATVLLDDDGLCAVLGGCAPVGVPDAKDH